MLSQQRYLPFGDVRTDLFAPGTISQTDFGYTGQRDVAGMGLMDYKARFYDPGLGRFAQADTIIPNVADPQSWNRFAYVQNRPLSLSDPSGHCPPCDPGSDFGDALVSLLFPRADAATHQALDLVADWFLETGPRSRTFGPNEPLTREVQNASGVDEFKKMWANAGHPNSFTAETTIDTRSGPLMPRVIGGALTYAKSHLVDLPLSALGFGSKDPSGGRNAVNGTIGSLDRVSVSRVNDEFYRFDVYNEMGWASGTRIPGTRSSILRNRDRREFGPGGTIEQDFYWYERVPRIRPQ